MSTFKEDQKNFGRRNFLKSAGLTVAGLSVAPALISFKNPVAQAANVNERTFPEGFLWGTATASYQVEGAANEDGRGTTIWDTFSHTPGNIKNNDNGDVACDFYHRYPADIKLMKEMNVKAFRLSVAWSRIFPDGTGTPNQKGIDFYKKLTDNLLENGIEPFATLYHWDLPQTLQDKYKGWESRETSKTFGEYAGFIAKSLGDRVKHYFTLNEMSTFVELGYGIGIFAPGLKLPQVGLNQVRHHAVLAHGLAVQAIRANAPAGTKIGLAENLNVPVPIIDTPENIQASEIAMREENAGYLTVVMEGKYTGKFLKKAGADAPKFTDEDLKIISSPLDFVGINVYTPAGYVQAADNEDGYKTLPFAKSQARSTSPWQILGPESLYWAPKNVQKLWAPKEMYITENGTSGTDELTAEKHVYDTDRVSFMRNYLTQLQKATAEGVPVKGYFYWSMMDNFEWTSGYGTRFGLYYVDYKTLERIPKESVAYFKVLAQDNKVV